MPSISTHQVVDQGGKARELGVAQGVVPEGEAHDAYVSVGWYVCVCVCGCVVAFVLSVWKGEIVCGAECLTPIPHPTDQGSADNVFILRLTAPVRGLEEIVRRPVRLCCKSADRPVSCRVVVWRQRTSRNESMKQSTDRPLSTNHKPKCAQSGPHAEITGCIHVHTYIYAPPFPTPPPSRLSVNDGSSEMDGACWRV